MANPKDEDKRPTVPSVRATTRPKRTPINGEGNKLTVEPQEPGYHYIWVNEDKVGKYERGGYEFVTHPVSIGDAHVNHASSLAQGRTTLPMGNGVIGVLMRCTLDIYEEELALVHAKADQNELAMMESLRSKEDGRYGDVKVKSETVKGRGAEPTTSY